MPGGASQTDSCPAETDDTYITYTVWYTSSQTDIDVLMYSHTDSDVHMIQWLSLLFFLHFLLGPSSQLILPGWLTYYVPHNFLPSCFQTTSPSSSKKLTAHELRFQFFLIPILTLPGNGSVPKSLGRTLLHIYPPRSIVQIPFPYHTFCHAAICW